MMPYDLDDQPLRTLAQLPPLSPDPVRTARVRAQCRTQLARIQRRSEHTALTLGFGRRILAPAVVLGLCALYVASLVSTVLNLRRVF